MDLEQYFIDDYITDAELAPVRIPEPVGESMTFLTKYVNVVQVEEKGLIIHISGLSTDFLARDIKKMWETSKVNTFIFSKFGRRELQIPKFFAIELRYMCYALLDSGRAYSKRTLKAIIQGLEENTWLKTIIAPSEFKLNFDNLKMLNLPLLKSQMDFLYAYQDIVPRYGLRGYMLAAPPGSGKTIGGLALALTVEAERVIVICPKNAVDEVWHKTIQIRYNVIPRVWTSQMNTPPDPKAEYLIFHYEAMEKAIQYLKSQPKKRTCVLLDESHNLNEVTAARSLRFIDLCELAEASSILWSSGTPLKAMGSEMVPFLTTIDPLFTPDVAKRFVQIFGKSVARATDILAHRIGIVSFKVPKSEVVDLTVVETVQSVKFPGSDQFTLPKIRDEITKFVIERKMYYNKHREDYHRMYKHLTELYRSKCTMPQQRAALDAYLKDVWYLNKRFDPRTDGDTVKACNRFEETYILPMLIGEEKKQFRDCRSVVKYVDLKIRGEALGRILTKRRIECFAAMVEHAQLEAIIEASEKKTLIFTSYVEVVKRLDAHLRTKGYSPLLVFGETNNDLKGIMETFRKSEGANPMIATFDSLSTAVPVIEANTCVLFNTPFRDYERNQATSRVNRLGQDSIVRIVTVLLDTGKEGNISTRSNDIMEWSKAQVDAIMGYDNVIDNIAL